MSTLTLRYGELALFQILSVLEMIMSNLAHLAEKMNSDKKYIGLNILE